MDLGDFEPVPVDINNPDGAPVLRAQLLECVIPAARGEPVAYQLRNDVLFVEHNPVNHPAPPHSGTLPTAVSFESFSEPKDLVGLDDTWLLELDADEIGNVLVAFLAHDARLGMLTHSGFLGGKLTTSTLLPKLPVARSRLVGFRARDWFDSLNRFTRRWYSFSM